MPNEIFINNIAYKRTLNDAWATNLGLKYSYETKNVSLQAPLRFIYVSDNASTCSSGFTAYYSIKDFWNDIKEGAIKFL